LYMALYVSISDRVFLASPRYLRLFFATSKIASPSYHLHSVPIFRTLDLAIAGSLDYSFTSLLEFVLPHGMWLPHQPTGGMATGKRHDSFPIDNRAIESQVFLGFLWIHRCIEHHHAFL
jgi:hypothetical protein